MNWILKLFGISNKKDAKKRKLDSLHQKAFEAQRNGNLSLAGKYLLEAEALETEIINESK